MRSSKTSLAALPCFAIISAILFPAFEPQAAGGAERAVPIIYSTDLFHPPDDADDTFDAAALFALKEFDIRGIVLDNARAMQVEEPANVNFKQRLGRPPLEQLMYIAGRKAKFAPGLPQPLTSADDKGLDQPKEYQGAVDLILSGLRESKEKVLLFNTGSCRDFAAAFNREPELFRQKVKAIYCNGGTVLDRGDVSQIDYNVTLDPWSFFRMFETEVPFHWCGTRPKMSEHAPGGLYSTSFWIHQEAVIRAGTPAVQNYFYYALTQGNGDPVAFLDGGFKKVLPAFDRQTSDGGRFMWCIGPLCHAAGRNIYRQGIANFLALRPEEAETAGLADKKIELFDFVPVTVVPKKAPRVLTLDFKTEVDDPRVLAFHRPVSDLDYQTVMERVLLNLIAGLGREQTKSAR